MNQHFGNDRNGGSRAPPSTQRPSLSSSKPRKEEISSVARPMVPPRTSISSIPSKPSYAASASRLTSQSSMLSHTTQHSATTVSTISSSTSVASSSTSSSRIQAPITKKPDEFGIIIALKETFGFIQPYKGDEQIYFGDREFYGGVSVGDEVCYIKRPNSKGFHAERVRLTNPGAKEFIPDIIAVVSREPDGYKNLPGMLEISDEATLKRLRDHDRSFLFFPVREPFPPLPFMLEEVAFDSSSKSTKKLFKGDEVSCSVVFIAGSHYLKAGSVRLVRGRRERLIADQVLQLQSSGLAPDQGVIDTIKNNEYGFIRSVSRPDQVYFRVEDAGEPLEDLKEDTEVEFFVIVEVMKGKACDRAVHLRVLPPGTVQFEVTVAEGVIGTVIKDPSNSPGEGEKPGRIRLHAPLSMSPGKTVSEVELWARCLPEDLQVLAGDTISFDLKHYRPENLLFARAVQVLRFRALGRELGVIVALKDQGFGFIRSHLRDLDLYFRVSEVRDEEGRAASSEGALLDRFVSFDVVIDETRGRARRVQLLPPSAADLTSLRFFKIETCLRGVILKDAPGKRESPPGQIQLAPASLERIRGRKFHPEEAVASLREFLEGGVPQVSLRFLPAAQRGVFHDVIDDLFADSLSHETVEGAVGASPQDPAQGRVLRISRCSAPATLKGGDSQVEVEEDVVYFQRSDVDESRGPLARDLQVEFDLFIDKRTRKKVAKSVRLTEEILEGGRSGGVIEALVGSKSGRFGFLRSFREEKLFFHVFTHEEEGGGGWREGQEVSFSLRRRGGVRCATDLLPGAVTQRTEAETPLRDLLGVTVPGGILMVDSPPHLYWDLRILQGEVEKVEEDKKYYPGLGRGVLPVEGYEGRSEGGTLVLCEVQRIWTLPPNPPLRVLSVRPTSAPALPRTRGTITRVKVKLEGSSLDFCEVQGGLFCLMSEVQSPSGPPPQPGDAVDFLPLPDRRLALHVTLLTKFQASVGGKVDGGARKAGTGVDGIVMAKGPPSDAAVGFDEGWRVHPNLASLPWAHLFSS